MFHDNYFAGILLQVTLEKLKIHSISTVRANRLKGCVLKSDKDMKKIGRGTHQELLLTVVDDVEVRFVKWYDNKPVHVLSTYASAQPIS